MLLCKGSLVRVFYAQLLIRERVGQGLSWVSYFGRPLPSTLTPPSSATLHGVTGTDGNIPKDRESYIVGFRCEVFAECDLLEQGSLPSKTKSTAACAPLRSNFYLWPVAQLNLWSGFAV